MTMKKFEKTGKASAGCTVVYVRLAVAKPETNADLQRQTVKTVLEKEGMEVSAYYEDLGISGLNMANRPGIQRLMQDARAGKFNAVACESLDRLSRNMADLKDTIEKLREAGVEVHEVSNGQIVDGTKILEFPNVRRGRQKRS